MRDAICYVLVGTYWQNLYVVCLLKCDERDNSAESIWNLPGVVWTCKVWRIFSSGHHPQKWWICNTASTRCQYTLCTVTHEINLRSWSIFTMLFWDPCLTHQTELSQTQPTIYSPIKWIKSNLAQKSPNSDTGQVQDRNLKPVRDIC